VWPLEALFGAVARISNADQHEFHEEELLAWWVAPRGDVQCSCRGSTAQEATLDMSSPTAVDRDCYHAKLFADSLTSVGALIGDSDSKRTRSFVSRESGLDVGATQPSTTAAAETRAGATVCRAQAHSDHRGRSVTCRASSRTANKRADDFEDAEAEVFATGGLPIAVFVAGDGRWRVPAPVKCARTSTSCCYCDTSRKKTCVCLHVLHTCHLRQSDVASGNTQGTDSSMKKAISRLKLSEFDCDKSVQVDTALMDAAREDKVYIFPAPAECPKCGTPRGEAAADPSTGTVLSMMCMGQMQLDAYNCSCEDCGMWVCAQGLNERLVILSPGTAASVMLVRHFASQVAVEGSPFSQTFRTWWLSAQQRRRASVRSSTASGRGRPTVALPLSVGLRLMGMEVPAWPFLCSTCCNGDQIDLVSADGIWLGYLRRLLAPRYTTYSEKCNTDASLLTCASLIGSEWVRPYMLLALTDPRATVSVGVEQRKVAALALAVLLPGALPQSFKDTFPSDQKAGSDALNALLSTVCDLDAACTELVRGVLGAMKRFIAAARTNIRPLPASSLERKISAHITVWLAARPVGMRPKAPAEPPVARASTAAAAAAAASAVAAPGGVADAAGVADAGPAAENGQIV